MKIDRDTIQLLVIRSLFVVLTLVAALAIYLVVKSPIEKKLKELEAKSLDASRTLEFDQKKYEYYADMDSFISTRGFYDFITANHNKIVYVRLSVPKKNFSVDDDIRMTLPCANYMPDHKYDEDCTPDIIVDPELIIDINDGDGAEFTESGNSSYMILNGYYYISFIAQEGPVSIYKITSVNFERGIDMIDKQLRIDGAYRE